MVDHRRLFRAQYQDIQIIEQINTQNYRVSGSQDKAYKVDLKNPSCTCPDWRDQAPRGGCKHILKIKLDREEINKLSYHQTSAGTSGSKSYSDNWRSLRKRVLKLDRWECQKCQTNGKHVETTELHVHHIIPKSQGGEDKISNLITLCHQCHEDVHGHKIPSGRYGSYGQGRSTGVDQTQNRATSSDSSPANLDEQAETPETSEESLPPSQPVVENALPPWSQTHPEHWESSSPSTSSTAQSSSDKNQSDTSQKPESNDGVISSQSSPSSSDIQPTPRSGNETASSQGDSKSNEATEHSKMESNTVSDTSKTNQSSKNLPDSDESTVDDTAHHPQISATENDGNDDSPAQTDNKEKASNQSATTAEAVLGLAVLIGILSYEATQNLSLSIGSIILILVGYMAIRSIY